MFADVGLDAPLSAVARTAGVGQGSLYRHFPTRADLALAVFEDNVAELEALADDPVTTLDDLLSLLTRQAVGSAAFVEMVTASADDPRLAVVVERVTTALAGKLRQAQAAGLVRGDADAAELFVAVGMIAALLVRTPAAGRPAAADAAWSLLRRGLGPPPREARRSAVVDQRG